MMKELMAQAEYGIVIPGKITTSTTESIFQVGHAGGKCAQCVSSRALAQDPVSYQNLLEYSSYRQLKILCGYIVSNN
jgi:hypothetical protein